MMYGWKYKIENEQHFKDLQRYWLNKGYKWCTNRKRVLDFKNILDENGEECGIPKWFYVSKTNKTFFYRIEEDGEKVTFMQYGHNTHTYKLSFLDIIPEDMFVL